MTSKHDNNWLESCLKVIPKVKVAVFGDFCIDAYWLIEPDETELSVETLLPVRRVRRQKYSLGGAANVAANLADLGVGKVYAISLIGDDMFGRLLLDMLERLNVDTSAMLNCQSDWQSFVFGKPCIADAEQNRMDFGGFNAISEDSTTALESQLDHIADKVDIVILNQQIPAGVSTPEVIERINAVVARHPKCKFIVDSRHRAQLYKGAMLKVNSHEAALMSGQERSLDDHVTAGESRRYATELFQRTSKPVFVTRGENGIVIADTTGLDEVPGIHIVEHIDSVGAGDTTVAALAAVLGCGVDCPTAARFANVAASVTVRKIQVTGTASPEELRRIGPDPDYIYLPELADDPRQAEFLEASEIEIIRPLSEKLNIRHAIFDHDGTISTLRQGWEQVMVEMMIRAILGSRYDDADEVLYHKVVASVRRYIDKTTGIQTLAQMQGLIDLVERFGCVPRDEILDIHGYKAIYNDALLKMVHARVEKLSRGELDSNDFQIKNALLLLETLHAKGVKMYLASGTDEADVIAEAEAMGYAHLFEGRIFGAVGDVKIEAKRKVLERIIREHSLTGCEFATFGDGPVEIRETRKREGVSVGIASDEIRRFGLDATKRTRLIRAGADLIIPDFSQLDRLMAALNLS